MSYQSVIVERKEHIGIITLNRYTQEAMSSPRTTTRF